MTYLEFVSELKTLELPQVYHHWPPNEVPELPFLVHYKTARDDVAADDINYFKVQNVILELYSDYADFENEERIETLLTSLGLFYQTDEPLFIDSERMFVKTYEFSLKGNQTNEQS